MALPVGVYLLITLRDSGMHGWGAAMSTDTALAMGLLGLVGGAVPDRMRAFLLTVFVVDDLVALAVIVAYSGGIELLPLGVAVIAFLILVGVQAAGVDRPPVFALLGVTMWAALLVSGVDPVVGGPPAAARTSDGGRS
jgi:Na+/H+ antiporter NhaA